MTESGACEGAVMGIDAAIGEAVGEPIGGSGAGLMNFGECVRRGRQMRHAAQRNRVETSTMANIFAIVLELLVDMFWQLSPLHPSRHKHTLPTTPQTPPFSHGKLHVTFIHQETLTSRRIKCRL